MLHLTLPKGEPFEWPELGLACATGQLQQSIATTLCVIAAARAERDAPPVQAARQHLGQIYGETRLRRRLEREASAA